MRVTCSHCRTQYSLPDAEIAGNAEPVYLCDECGWKIRIARCTGCGTPYSITFDTLEKQRYRARCRKCFIEFPVVFTEPSTDSITEYLKFPVRYDVSPAQAPGGPARKRREVAPWTGAVGAMEKQDATQRGDSPYPGFFSFSGFFQSALRSLTLERLRNLAVFLFAMTAIYLGFEAVLSMIGGIQGAATIIKPVNGFIPRFFAGISFLLSGSLVYFSIRDEMNGASAASAAVVFRRLQHPLLHSAVAAAVAVIAVRLPVFLFTGIPLLTPFLYALLFIPLYAIALICFTLLVLGTWSYPVVAARAGNGIAAAFVSFYHFIDRHRHYLIAPTVILGAVYAAAGSVLFVVHSTIMKAVQRLCTLFQGGRVFGTFNVSSTPGVTVTELASVKSIQVYFMTTSGSPLETIMGILNILIGAFLALLAVSLFLSATASLSAHAVISLENRVYPDLKNTVLITGTLLAIAAVSAVLHRLIAGI